MKIYDISVALDDNLPSWPGETTYTKKEKKDGPISVTEMNIGLHSGTHLDAPYHFIDKGKKMNEIALERFMGKCRVISIAHDSYIDVEELKRKELNGISRVLFKTENSKLWGNKDFDRNFIGLSLDGARYLIEKGIDLIGVDYLSVEKFDSPGNDVHVALLEKEVIILEGLDLKYVSDGDYNLICFPLKISDVEASPTRAVLTEL